MPCWLGIKLRCHCLAPRVANYYDSSVILHPSKRSFHENVVFFQANRVFNCWDKIIIFSLRWFWAMSAPVRLLDFHLMMKALKKNFEEFFGILKRNRNFLTKNFPWNVLFKMSAASNASQRLSTTRSISLSLSSSFDNNRHHFCDFSNASPHAHTHFNSHTFWRVFTHTHTLVHYEHTFKLSYILTPIRT